MAVKINKHDLLKSAGNSAVKLADSGLANSGGGGVVENDWLKFFANLKGAMQDIKEVYNIGKDFVKETGIIKKKDPQNVQQFGSWTPSENKVIETTENIEEKSKDGETMKWDYKRIKLVVGLACKVIGEDKTLKELKAYVEENEDTIKGLLS